MVNWVLFSQAVKDSVGDTEFESEFIDSDEKFDELISKIQNQV